MASKAPRNYPSRMAIAKRAIGAASAATAAIFVLPGVFALAAGFIAVDLTSRAAARAAMRKAGRRADPVKAQEFRELVLAEFQNEGVQPPRDIWLFNDGSSKAHRHYRGALPNAFASRAGRLGGGLVAATQSIMDTLTRPELSRVIRHEISHYANADSRSLEAYKAGGFVAGVVAVVTIFTGGLFSLPVLLSTAAASSLRLRQLAVGRKHERRADRDSIKSPEDAALAISAHIKMHVAHRRYRLERKGDSPSFFRHKQADAFGEPPDVPPTDEQLAAEAWRRPPLWRRIDNFGAGTHPLLYERLRRWRQIAGPIDRRVALGQTGAGDSPAPDGEGIERVPEMPARTPAPRLGRVAANAALPDFALTSRGLGLT